MTNVCLLMWMSMPVFSRHMGLNRGAHCFLFLIYINNIGCISERRTSAMSGTPSFRVSYMLYADDLALTAYNPKRMQQMLDRLQGWEHKKCLPINTKKI